MLSVVTVSLQLKRHRKVTFEVWILTLDCICLAFLIWILAVDKIFYTLFVLTLSGIAAFFGVWRFGRGRAERFSNREDLPMATIYSQFFADAKLQKDLVFELWNEVATLLRVPPGKLRPSDRFDKELASADGWLELDDDAQEVNRVAQYRLKRLGGNADFSAVLTLGDYINFFCKSVGNQ